MNFYEILAARALAPASAVDAAIETQQGDETLAEALTRLGALRRDQILTIEASAAYAPPPPPRTLDEVGVSEGLLRSLLLKFMAVQACERVSELAEEIRLPHRIVEDLIAGAGDRKLVQSLGMAAEGLRAEIRFGLTDEGRRAADLAMAQCQYLGPAPVTLAAFQAQIARQSIARESIPAERLRAGLAGLVAPETLVRRLLPAINAGRSMLLFGPPGNGKTSVAARIGALFEQVIHLPHAVEVAGHIMKVFDPGLHRAVVEDDEWRALNGRRLVAERADDRWVPCRRPFVRAGGELDAGALDLQFDPVAKFYDAPLHVKALGGVFLIDDFGRQRIDPRLLLNRWIAPMEDRSDILHLHTGASINLPFDALLVFSTNIDPQEIMDAAFLRRIPYKILFAAPDRADFRRLFVIEAAARNLELPEETFSAIVEALTTRVDFGLALFQPRFICEQVAAIRRLYDMPPVITRELAMDALANLYVQLDDTSDSTPVSHSAAVPIVRFAPRPPRRPAAIRAALQDSAPVG